MFDYTNENKIMVAGNRELTEYFQMLLFINESTDDYLFLYDLKEQMIYFTNDISVRYALPSVSKGYCLEDWKRIVYSRDITALIQDLQAIQCGEKTIQNMEYRLIDRKGNLIWISSRGKVIFDNSHKPTVLIGRISDTILTPKTDPLTGLMTFSKLLEELEILLKNKTCGTLLVLGIDNFKHINKKYGRGFGNAILKKTAHLLENCIADNFQIYRLDGDRFAINLSGYQQSEVLAVYKEIQYQMIKNYTLSAGAVSYPISKIQDANTLFNYAESSLDRAKKEGKNRLCFFSEKEYEQQLYFIDLTEEMKHSMQNQFQGFSLQFQPQVVAQTYEIVGAEALLRYHSAYHGDVSPGVFIHILEQNGLIVSVGHWVLKEAITQCKKWRSYYPNFRMSINLSYVQLQQKDFNDSIFKLLDEAALPGEAIILELTESMQLQDYSSFNQLFYQWERRGIQISIDDFGTGYSTLSYLKSLAIDEIKIDRCFISSIHLSAYNYHLLHNMLELAHSAQIRVCCEGVESFAELQTLEQLYPDVLQGFFFSKPLPADEFETKYFFNRQTLQNWRKKIQEQISTSPKMTHATAYNSDFKTVLDQMDEIIFISDMESYELCYMNPSGKRITGISDYEGRKCYKVLQGSDAPCQFCISDHLIKNTFRLSYFDNHYLGHQFLLKDKMIMWNGRTARLEIAFDLTNADKHDLNKMLPFASTFSLQNNLFQDGSITKMSNMLREEDILKATKLGLWIIQIDTNTNIRRMFVDKSMNDILGVAGTLSSEAYYQHWYENINDGYYNYVNNAVQEMITSGKIIELEYTWNHPARGEVPVRCAGILSKVENGVYTLKGYHRIVGDMVQKRFLKNQTVEMFEYNETKHTIYFHTNRSMIAGEQSKEMDFPNCWVTQQLIHPYFIKEFQTIFSFVKEHSQTQTLNLLLKNKAGDYEWFRMETHHIGNAVQDINTLIVSLYPIMENQTIQSQYVRKDDFYQAMLSETIAYAELDLTTGMLQNSGGLWETYTIEERNKNRSFQNLVDIYIDAVVIAEDRDLYYQYLSIATMRQSFQEGKPTINCQCRRIIADDIYHWMELVIHVFQEQVTEKMYALLYLKDIDDSKQQQLKQEKDAYRDPLTNTLNRRMFEQCVQEFMIKQALEGGQYALLMLDLDNFKEVNDTLGHHGGDAVLKTFVAALRETFQQDSDIGRLGGDEFAVFIKQDIDKETLNKWLTSFINKLKNNKQISISCSIGITFITCSNYQYETVLKQADDALYCSKRNGKCTFRYWDVQKQPQAQ